MCEGFLRIEMHALLHWFLFLERKEDARNSERIFFRGSKMLLQTNPVIRKKNMILVIKKKKEFLNENRARIFNLNSMDQVQQLKILEYYFLNTEPLNHAISVQTIALSLTWNHCDCFL